MVCERRDGLTTIVVNSVCTCFNDILTKLEQKVDEVKTEVSQNGENIQEIIDMHGKGGFKNYI